MKADRFWIAAVLLWAAAQVAWRFAQGPSLELDEAEALFHARNLLWGYNAQPPLYFWLQWAMFQLTGNTVLGLALLKNVLLAVGALTLYSMLRRLRSPFEAGVAVLALGLLPQVLWEAQRALTHSVLALVMAMVIMNLADRVLRGNGGDSSWCSLGVAIGLGAISKWNVALLPVAIFGAAVCYAEWRARLNLRSISIAVVAAFIVIAPPTAWVLTNPVLAAGSLHKLEIESGSAITARIEGLGSLAFAWLSFGGLAIILVLCIWLVTRKQPFWRPDRQAQLMIATMAAAAVLLVIGVIVSGTTAIKDRWLLPLAVFWGPLVGLWAIQRLGPQGQAYLARGLAGLWALAFALLPFSGWVEPGYRGTNFSALASRIETEHRGTALATDSTWLAGNLVLHLPENDIAVIMENDVVRDCSVPRLWISRSGDAVDLARRAGCNARELAPQLTQQGQDRLEIQLAITPLVSVR